MKKMIVALAAVALAACANAATFSWATYTGQYVYQAGTSLKLSGATAYLFDTSTITQELLISGILDNGKSLTSYDSLSFNTTSTSGVLAKKEFTADDSVNLYFAIMDGDNLFVSSVVPGTGSDVGTTALTFKGISTASKAEAIEWAGASSFAGAGWYTQSVPEPTSGLLMLLGMAGLALRRRRA